MNHLSEEQLIEHYYGEGTAEVKHHLGVCGACEEAYAALANDLAKMKNLEPPARAAQYGEQAWRSLSNLLAAYPRRKATWPPTSLRIRASYAAACALLIAGGFLAGRRWEQRKSPLAGDGKQVKQQIVLVVLGDHLDRSERLLIELKHAEPDSAEMVSPLRKEARDLLPANRQCRQKAIELDDPALAAVLDHFDRVLAELANQPEALSGPVIARLQTEANTDGLLFEIRVLRTRLPDKDQSRVPQLGRTL